MQGIVLDEADEMLKMGFIDDVKWILQRAPEQKQIALFSATMPESIRAIAGRHLTDPVEITIESQKCPPLHITQRYLLTKNVKQKKEALQALLETENFAGMIIFVRTKAQTLELAEYLHRLEYSCGPLNGDIPQNQRIRMINQLQSGGLDIVVATDVAARGIDVERVSHVINFDVPFDTDSYVHRIGRTAEPGAAATPSFFFIRVKKDRSRCFNVEHKKLIEEMKIPQQLRSTPLESGVFRKHRRCS